MQEILSKKIGRISFFNLSLFLFRSAKIRFFFYTYIRTSV
ncbi:hypothetical protein LEP1GSC132_1072 [Leptospira kirschneri str. 200803703]|uniref:Uncharacterized protein n=1 Tax=Leptospira kirschneri str. 200802841 TaxID=1193047 RepID=A0A828Y6F7_9LEPT|nr:hypothetical protein LEP1GSC044_0009 [Leptospira kirschneri serovar Grippotyphosa str. RM52]EKO52625.1 hypothetical protein LEP1GSC131_0870 [Leptospira kirschneri str. 200802841]EKP03629.1 hypothetical protein LEP1GSC018_0406 [Leptospira kirschneri str. 2008720114]EKQ84995.1 hypothetical protein LEP1GSC064_1767 [Leptospira kirschneri serovar Grippotyphosa str. Moskva]EKR07985.1 hypothetical protein LEP1GSC122_2407 [Leptospira kirschneri serovar Valbuzzi str. 200702274]EMO68810.1 hypothetica